MFRLSLWVKSYSANIQMKAMEQFSPVVLFIMLYNMFVLSTWMTSYSATIQMKAIEQFFPVVLFMLLHKVYRICICEAKFLNVTIRGYRKVFCCGALYNDVEDGFELYLSTKLFPFC